jgi:hypothetical protein
VKSDIQRMKARIRKAQRRIERGDRVEEETRRIERLSGILAVKGIQYPNPEGANEGWTTN